MSKDFEIEYTLIILIVQNCKEKYDARKAKTLRMEGCEYTFIILIVQNYREQYDAHKAKT